MSLTADLGRVPLTLLLDLRHPLAYLALHPAMAFAASEGVAIDWLPLTVPPLNPPTEPAEGDDRGIRHRRHRAQAIAREVRVYGDAQGLVLREIYRRGDAQAANLGWLWVRDRIPDRLPSFLADLFRAYWSMDLDASDGEQVANLVDAAGGDGAAFLCWSTAEGPPAADSLAGELRAHGLFQVPAYVVGDEVFFGRQHLPMIRWLLAGGSGPLPI